MHKGIAIFLWMGLLWGVLAACNSGPGSESGQDLAVSKGCTACHAIDGSTNKIGPTWVGLYGSQVELDNGSMVNVDDDYLRESILNPSAKVARGYTKSSMPKISLTEAEVAKIIDYIKTIQG